MAHKSRRKLLHHHRGLKTPLGEGPLCGKSQEVQTSLQDGGAGKVPVRPQEEGQAQGASEPLTSVSGGPSQAARVPTWIRPCAASALSPGHSGHSQSYEDRSGDEGEPRSSHSSELRAQGAAPRARDHHHHSHPPRRRGKGPVTPRGQGRGHGHPPRWGAGTRSPPKVGGGDTVTPHGGGEGAGHPSWQGAGTRSPPTARGKGPITPRGKGRGHGHPPRWGAGTRSPPTAGGTGPVTPRGKGRGHGHPRQGGWGGGPVTPHGGGWGVGTLQPALLALVWAHPGPRGSTLLPGLLAGSTLQSIGRLQTFFAHPQPTALARGQDCSWHVGLTLSPRRAQGLWPRHQVHTPAASPAFATHRRWCPDRPAGPCPQAQLSACVQVSFTVPETTDLNT